jgi:hypothetical protein
LDPRAGLDDLERRNFLTLPGLELRHLSRPASSQSLYRLPYRGFWSSLGACKIADETDVLPSVNTNFWGVPSSVRPYVCYVYDVLVFLTVST